MRLAELQGHFWAAVRTRGAPPAGLEQWLTGNTRQTPAERLAVYHLAYWQRQATALASTFPLLQTELGVARCERLILGYVEERPCTEPCIEWLGRHFVDFLALRKVSAHALGVARLEWAHVESLLAPDASGAAQLPRDLGPALAERRLAFVPSLRVEHVPLSSFNVFAPELSRDATAADSASLEVAFYRPNFAVKHVALAPDEARAHALAREGATIALICTAFSHLPIDEAALRAHRVLSTWFARGWIARCEP